MSELYVDVRIRVRQDVYRTLFAEADRRKLGGAADLVELLLHKQVVPAPPKQTWRLDPEAVKEIVRRGTGKRRESSAAIAADYGITPAGVNYHLRKARELNADELARSDLEPAQTVPHMRPHDLADDELGRELVARAVALAES